MGAFSHGSQGNLGCGAGNQTELGGNVSMRDVPRSGGPSTAMAPPVPQPPFMSIAFPARAGGCFHPSPSRKKSLIQAVENICKSNYLPKALPGALPACPPPSAPGSPGFVLPGCFSGHTKGLARLDAGTTLQQLCPLLQRPSMPRFFQPQLPPPLPWRAAHLWPWDGWWEPCALAGGSHPGSAAHLLQGCAMVGTGTPSPAPPPVRGLGSLPCFSPLLFPAASRTGFTGTLRPGCFPINCYFLIPFAARRAATQLRLSAGCPPALIEGRQDGAPPAPGWPQPWSPSPAQSQARSWSWF